MKDCGERKDSRGQIFGKDQHQGVLNEKAESGKDSGRHEDQESTAEAERGISLQRAS